MHLSLVRCLSVKHIICTPAKPLRAEQWTATSGPGVGARASQGD